MLPDLMRFSSVFSVGSNEYNPNWLHLSSYERPAIPGIHLVNNSEILSCYSATIISRVRLSSSRVAQRKRAGPITKRSMDWNHFLLFTFSVSVFKQTFGCFPQVSLLFLYRTQLFSSTLACNKQFKLQRALCWKCYKHIFPAFLREVLTQSKRP